MKKKMVSVLVAFAVVLVIAGTYVSAAGFTRRTFYIPANTVVRSATYNRSGNYAYVTAKLHAVYPPSGEDTYTRLQFGNAHAGYDRGYVTLVEGHAGVEKLYVTQHKLTVKPVRLLMKGNDASLSCYANVTFDAK